MYDDLIQTITTFIGLDEHDAALIRRLFQQRHLAPGTQFLLAGDVCREVGYITAGLVRYYINHEGDALINGFGAEREFVCDYPSFLVAQPSQNNIEVLEPTEMLTISFDQLQQLYRDLTHGERFGRLVAESLFVQAADQLTSFYRDSPAQRYQRFLNQFPQLATRIPQYYIASYVGVQPQSLSRIRRRFAKQQESRP